MFLLTRKWAALLVMTVRLFYPWYNIPNLSTFFIFSCEKSSSSRLYNLWYVMYVCMYVYVLTPDLSIYLLGVNFYHTFSIDPSCVYMNCKLVNEHLYCKVFFVFNVCPLYIHCIQISLQYSYTQNQFKYRCTQNRFTVHMYTKLVYSILNRPRGSEMLKTRVCLTKMAFINSSLDCLKF